MSINIDILDEFVTLAKKLNFSKTANEHFITQPVLTKHIKQLEDDLGAPLFYRDRQSVKLSPMGELFLPDAEAIVATYAGAKSKIRDANNEYAQSLSIAFLDGVAREDLPQWLKEFNQKFPNVYINCFCAEFIDIIDMMKNQQCDLAVTVQMPMLDYPEYNTFLLRKDPICLFVPKDHPLAEKSAASILDLDGEPVILGSSCLNKEYLSFIAQLLKKNNVKPSSIRHIENVHQTFALINSGLGISLVPSHHIIFSSSNIKMIPLDENKLYINIVANWMKSNANPNVENFLKIIKRTKVAEHS